MVMSLFQRTNFKLKKVTVITAQLLFYLQLAIVSTKLQRFVEYTPENGFNGFYSEQWTPEDKVTRIQNRYVVTERFKLVANSSYGYQIMNRSQQTVTKYLRDGRTHTTIENKLFKQLDHVNNALCEFELNKTQIEHKEPIIVGLFILQNAKLRMLELYYKLFSLQTLLKEYKWTEILCILFLPRVNLKFIFHQKSKQSENDWDQKIALKV